MVHRYGVILCMLLAAGVLMSGCSSPGTEPPSTTAGNITPVTTKAMEQTPVQQSPTIPCGKNFCQASEQCCNGFCIDPALNCCCNGKPCQGSCCNVSGKEQCYDPKKQECCDGTLCNVGSCCAGTCSPAGQYFCVYVNGTGCYGLPNYVNYTWNGVGYKLYRTNVPFGEVEPTYMDIVIIPATSDRNNISEYWIVPAIGGGGTTLAKRVKIV